MSIAADNTARRPRAMLPEGNVPLEDGRTLFHDWNDSFRMLDMRAKHGMNGPVRVYRTLERHALLVIASIGYTPKWGPLLHISFSYAKRWPGWEEIKHLKQAFYGDMRGVSMHLPAAEYYVNLDKNTFHLWEDPEEWNLQ